MSVSARTARPQGTEAREARAPTPSGDGPGGRGPLSARSASYLRGVWSPRPGLAERLLAKAVNSGKF